jgi:hypothetical protein
VARDKKSGSKGRRDTESMDSGKMGERNRNTPGRTAGELGLDRDETRGQDILGGSQVHGDARPGVSDAAARGSGNLAGTGGEGGARKNPPLTEDIASGEGGISQSGGAAGGARGHAGTSDRGAGGPLGDMRSGPGQHKSTSRGDLDHGTS